MHTLFYHFKWRAKLPLDLSCTRGGCVCPIHCLVWYSVVNIFSHETRTECITEQKSAFAYIMETTTRRGDGQRERYTQKVKVSCLPIFNQPCNLIGGECA